METRTEINSETTKPRIKPKFNVVEPFQGTVIVQMNREMRELLSDFIDFVTTDYYNDEEVDRVEREIVAFGKALQDPVKSRELRDSKRDYKRRNSHLGGSQQTKGAFERAADTKIFGK